MTISENSVIGELVAKDYRTASVFKKYGIDFCCQGNRTINDACQAQELDEKNVVADLAHLSKSNNQATNDYQSWPLDLLADYIEKKHHRYVVQKSGEIIPYINKICKVHGQRHPELFEVKALFIDSTEELAMHMQKEEMVLFPFVRKMAEAEHQKRKLEMPPFGSIKNPIEMMKHEHSNEGDRFRKIEELTNNYTAPEDACNTYRVTFALLKEFEADLHLHIHLENNILFPKAIEMEKNLV